MMMPTVTTRFDFHFMKTPNEIYPGIDWWFYAYRGREAREAFDNARNLYVDRNLLHTGVENEDR